MNPMADVTPEVWVSAARAARESGHCRKTIMRWIEQRRLDVERTEGPRQDRYRVRLDQVVSMRKVTPKCGE